MLDVWTAIVNSRAAEDALGTRVEDFMKCGIAGINLRLPKNASQIDYWESLCCLAATAVEAGIKYSVHSWVGSRHRSGRSEANQLTAIPDAVNVAHMIYKLTDAAGEPPLRYGSNAERDVWRGPGGRANPDANRYLKQFATLLTSLETGAEVEYLGFADPDVHYADSDADKDGQKDDEVAPETRVLFSQCQVMAYQSSLNQITSVVDRARAAWPGHSLGVFVGCGRVDSIHGVIGSEAASRHIITNPVANLRELTFYVGNDAERQLLVGNKSHASIYDIVTSLTRKDEKAT